MKFTTLNSTSKWLSTLVLLAFFQTGWAAETKEKIVGVSDTEQSQFEKELEDRIARDIFSYLGHNHFILNVNAQLQKMVVSKIEKVAQNEGISAAQSANQNQNFKQEETNTQERMGGNSASSSAQAKDVDIALPGLPTGPSAGSNTSSQQNAGPTGTKTIYEKKITGAPTQSGPQQNTAPVFVEKETVIEEKIKIKQLKVNLVLDNQVTAEQMQFVKTIVLQKAQISVIRGDELSLSKTDFPGANLPENTAEVDPLQQLIDWVYAYWQWLLAALVLLLVWWLMARKSKKEEVVDNSTPPLEIQHSAAELTLRDPEDSAAKAEIEAMKEQVVNIAVSDAAAAERYMTALSSSSDEVEKTKLVVLYNAMGKSLFASLFKKVFSKSDIDQIAAFAREIGANLSQKDAAVYMQDAYKGMMSVYFETQQENDRGQQLRPFSFLKELDDSQIVYLMDGESSRVKAIVLSQLTADRAANVIGALQGDDKNIVLAEMTQIRQVPLSSLHSIASMLAKKARNAPSFENVTVAGLDLIVNILERMDVVSERDMLKSLEKDDPDLYHSIRQIYITFDDLPRLPVLALKNLTRELEREQLALALYDVDEGFQNTLLEALPERPRLMTKSLIANLGTPDSMLVQDAKRLMARKARDMLKANLFDISEMAQPSDA